MTKNPPKNWWSPIVISLISTSLVQIMVGVIFSTMKAKDTLFKAGTFFELFGSICILANIILINKFYNKRPIKALGFRRKIYKPFACGVLYGLLMCCSVFFLMTIIGLITVHLNNSINWKFIVIIFFGFIIQSLAEEVMFRGYIQNSIAVHKGKTLAIVIQALIFASVHVLNPEITIISALNLVLLGLVLGVIYSFRDNIWLVAGMHFAWNFLLGVVQGGEVSGNTISESIFDIALNGHYVLTGGNFGIEGSIITSIVFMATLGIVYHKFRLRE